MTLSEFNSKFYSRPTIAPPTTIYVFTSEDSADAWIECRYFNSTDANYKLACVIQSDMVAKYFLNERFIKAEIQHFYAVEPDVIVAVVEPYREDGADGRGIF